MGCKNCKSKKLAKNISSTVNNTADSITSSLQQRKMDILKNSWDDSMGNFNLTEKIVLIIFAWVPLILGYITIVRFIVSLF
jgi:hypothetical protein